MIQIKKYNYQIDNGSQINPEFNGFMYLDKEINYLYIVNKKPKINKDLLIVGNDQHKLKEIKENYLEEREKKSKHKN